MDDTGTRLTWRRAEGCVGGDCVEVSPVWQTGDHPEKNLAPDGMAVRNSRDPDGPVLTFTRSEWEQFLAGAHNGEFDLPADAGQH